jgi:hypothetical protein
MEELSALAKAGKPLYGETDLPEYIQGVSHRNSVWSQLKFGTLPWRVLDYVFESSDVWLHRFNTVNHKYHGVDTSKYTGQQQE